MLLKNSFLFTLLLILSSRLSAQTDLLGNWELCKLVKLPADTQLINADNELYIRYNFNYNNTFLAYHQKEKEEANGKWGFDRKENAIKIRNHTFIKTKTVLPDYNIKIAQLTKTSFVEVIEDKKGKPVLYKIYRKLPA